MTPNVSKTVRAVAFYLPQFHPIPENDQWWGRGFTEWTNTARAKPLFRGHYQPHVPADLGFCDLRVPETRAAQAEMAQAHGIEGFCYYHYWFAGRCVLERPFSEVLTSGTPDLPFCLCWANEDWTGIWSGNPDNVLIKQEYPGEDDHRRHFDALLPAFADRRHLRVDGRPVFVIYRPWEIPDVERVLSLWRDRAAASGLPGLHLMAVRATNFAWVPQQHGFDASIEVRVPLKHPYISRRHPIRRLLRALHQRRRLPTMYDFREVVDDVVQGGVDGLESYPCPIPNWDNTPRLGSGGVVLQGATPELFRVQIRKALALTRHYPDERRFVFLKSWNEWAEGNHLEPDLRDGLDYLRVLKEEIVAAPLASAIARP